MLVTVAMVRSDITARFAGLERIISNTPLLAIDYEIHGRTHHLRQKRANEFHRQHQGHDGVAHSSPGLCQGRYPLGDTIVEATSGNTGISFAALGRALGHPVTIFMPNWMSRERMDLIHSLGANIIPVTKAQGRFLGSIHMARSWPLSGTTFSCRDNFPTPLTPRRMSRPLARNCTGS